MHYLESKLESGIGIGKKLQGTEYNKDGWRCTLNRSVKCPTQKWILPVGSADIFLFKNFVYELRPFVRQAKLI